MGAVGIYPGSFNPPTVAHLAIAEAAWRTHRLERVVLSVSRSALAKEHVDHPPFDDRIAVIERSIVDLDWLTVEVTHQQLLADIADGYDLLIVGADKWHQIQDPSWYGDDPIERDRAIARLPDVAVAPRDGIRVAAHLVLDIPGGLADGVSSSRARQGDLDLMTPAAREFADRSGAWIDPLRFDRWRAEQR